MEGWRYREIMPNRVVHTTVPVRPSGMNAAHRAARDVTTRPPQCAPPRDRRRGCSVRRFHCSVRAMATVFSLFIWRERSRSSCARSPCRRQRRWPSPPPTQLGRATPARAERAGRHARASLASPAHARTRRTLSRRRRCGLRQLRGPTANLCGRSRSRVSYTSGPANRRTRPSAPVHARVPLRSRQLAACRAAPLGATSYQTAGRLVPTNQVRHHRHHSTRWKLDRPE